MVRKPSHTPSDARRSGQAMAEFLVGLVCIMLLMAGMQQVSFLSQQGFSAMHNARRGMADQLVDTTFTEWWQFGFAGPTDPGPDGKGMTADDLVILGDDSFYQGSGGYLERVYDDLTGAYLTGQGTGYNPQNDLKYSEVFSASKALQMAYSADMQTVEVVPFLDKVLGRDKLLITREVWMPRLDKLK